MALALQAAIEEASSPGAGTDDHTDPASSAPGGGGDVVAPAGAAGGKDFHDEVMDFFLRSNEDNLSPSLAGCDLWTLNGPHLPPRGLPSRTPSRGR